MSKLTKLLYGAALFTACISTSGQIRIVKSTINSSVQNSSAFIDASSFDEFNQSSNVGKGLLYPRTHLAGFTSFNGIVTSSPNDFPTLFDGMIVYNVDNGGVAGVGATEGTLCRGFWYYDNPTSTLNGGTWRPSRPCSTIPGDITITSCGTPQGYLAKGLAANSADIAALQQLTVNITTPGTYTFATNTLNGVSFNGTKTFAASGTNTIDLIASGIPIDYTVGNNEINYTVSINGVNGASSSCNFGRKVYVPDQNYTGSIKPDNAHRFLYKVILGPGGYEWFQTNLGAHYNQVGHANFNPEGVATGVNDYLAFGSLFQLARNSDGHELINWTSGTNGTPMSATSTTFTADSGLFYTGNTPYGSSQVIGGELVVGPGMPCPDGFKVAQYDYYQAGYNAGPSYWLNNSLKLVAPRQYRDGETGNMTAMSRRLIRINQSPVFPDPVIAAPEFVLEGGEMRFANSNSIRDRRTFEGNNGPGHLDGYPIRCMK